MHKPRGWLCDSILSCCIHTVNSILGGWQATAYPLDMGQRWVSQIEMVYYVLLNMTKVQKQETLHDVPFSLHFNVVQPSLALGVWLANNRQILHDLSAFRGISSNSPSACCQRPALPQAVMAEL